MTKSLPHQEPPTGAESTARKRRGAVVLFAVILAAASTGWLIWWLQRDRADVAVSRPGAAETSSHASDSSAATTIATARRPNEPAADPHAAAALLSPSERGFVTSEACRNCHPDEHRTWHASYHRKMTQHATPETVIAPMQDVRLEAYGRKYHLQQRGSNFFVTLVEPEWELALMQRGRDPLQVADPPMDMRQIVATTGSHHMQTYWMRAQDGMRQVPWYWHIGEQRWIPSEDSFLRPPDAGRLFAMWNNVCIKCHAVGGQPGYDFRGAYDTQVAELGIACEACHGAGRDHVAFQAQLALAAAGKPTAADTQPPAGDQPREQPPGRDPIVNPAKCSPEVASQICGQCHSSTRPIDKRAWLRGGSQYQPGDDFAEHFRLMRFSDPEPEVAYYARDGYWGDGTCRTAGDEYLGLIDSACHQRGPLSCLSCHSLHRYADPNDQLRPAMDGNAACLSCHAAIGERLTEHTHHVAESSASLCYNCHMPHITYALFTAIRSHRIDSPRADISAATGRPNACNLCHLNQPLQWTANHLTDWYQQPRLDLPQTDRVVSAAVQWLLRGDAAQRAIAAWHFGWPAAHEASGDDWQAALLAETLDDPYSAVRFVGWRSLKKLPGFADFPFDFTAATESRRSAVARVLEKWTSQNPPAAPRPAVLLDDQGRLQSEAVADQIRRRDNRPLEIPE